MSGPVFDLDAAGSFALGSWRVNRVGYGAMQLAGDNVFGLRDRDEALRVLRAVIDSGINHIDTAQYYGPGVVNALIREALYPYPSDLAVVSEVAARRDERGAVLPRRPGSAPRGYRRQLATLGVDRLAAVNLRLGPVGDRCSVRRPARRAGRSPRRRPDRRHRPEQHLAGTPAASRRPDRGRLRVQNLFNLADQSSTDVLEECRDREIAFVPFCPLGWPRAVQNQILTSLVVAALAQRLRATPVQVTLAWLLDLAPNIVIIPGTRTRRHLLENTQAAAVRLDDPARTELGRHFPTAPPASRRT